MYQKISQSSVQTKQVAPTMSDIKSPNTFFKYIVSAFAKATVFSYSSVEEKSRGVLSSDIISHPTWPPCPIH